MLSTALGEVVPEAVGIAFSPIPIVFLILVLISPRPRTGGLSYAAGWTVGVFAASFVAFLLSRDGGDVNYPEDDGGSVVQVVLGLLFAALAIREWRRRPRPGVEAEPPKLLDAIDSMSPPKILGLGLAVAVANPANLPLAISGGLGIAETETSTGQGAIAVALFTILACSTVLLPIGAFLILGDRTHGPLDLVKTWLLAHNSTILVVLFGVLAAGMLGSGLGLLG